ncbi:MAG: hypothetical protein ACI8X5_004012, partial [Planctomycetota bacterium]
MTAIQYPESADERREGIAKNERACCHPSTSGDGENFQFDT